MADGVAIYKKCKNLLEVNVSFELTHKYKFLPKNKRLAENEPLEFIGVARSETKPVWRYEYTIPRKNDRVFYVYFQSVSVPLKEKEIEKHFASFCNKRSITIKDLA